jgi:phenylpropionate dioxygenase-like ring-hydroxylating dioxygenase large terminal subunit
MNFKSHYTPVLTTNLLQDKKPKQVFYHNKSVLLLRLDGKLRAYEDFCPHRGAPLSQGILKEGQIHCPYHGWSFSFDDGKNTNVPVKNESIHCELKKIQVLEKYGIIWLCMIENGTLPNLLNENPTIEISGFIKALVQNSIENFLEGSHTHYIHEGLIRSHKTKRQFIKALFEPNEFGFKVHYEEEKPKGLITKLIPRKYQNLKSTATYIYPNLTILEYFNQEDILISRFEGIFSADKNNTLFFARIFLNFGLLTPFIKPFASQIFKKVIQQDIKILEIQNRNMIIHQDTKFMSDSTDLVGQQIFAWLYDADKILKMPTYFSLYW